MSGKIIRIYVDAATLARLEKVSLVSGKDVETLAEDAVTNEAMMAFRHARREDDPGYSVWD